MKENVVLSHSSRSTEKFMHGIKVLMAKNYIDNLAEEASKGLREKAEQGMWPSYSPLGYRNVGLPDGRLAVELHAPFDLISKETAKAREADAQDLAKGVKRAAFENWRGIVDTFRTRGGHGLQAPGLPTGRPSLPAVCRRSSS